MSRAFPEGGLPALFPLAHGSTVTRGEKKQHNTPIQKRMPKWVCVAPLVLLAVACGSGPPRAPQTTLFVSAPGSLCAGWALRDGSVQKTLRLRGSGSCVVQPATTVDRTKRQQQGGAKEASSAFQICTELSRRQKRSGMAQDEGLAAAADDSRGKRRKAVEAGAGKTTQTSKRNTESVGILCYQCRRSNSSMNQKSIVSFLNGSPTQPNREAALRKPHNPEPPLAALPRASGDPAERASSSNSTVECSIMVCVKCRRAMEEEAPKSNAGSRAAATRICPSIAKVRGYKRVAAEKNIAWRILESDATRIMAQPCEFCGRLAHDNPGGFNGINRVNHSLPYYDFDNICAACSDCNTMKHDYSALDFEQICRHIATVNGYGDYGRFPWVFRNASSHRSRSGYLTKSKTFVLSKDEFNAIVAQPCHYCTRAPVPDVHYNGLDRLDSTVRVYTAESCVAACGTCNTMKWRRSPAAFVAHCSAVAAFAARREEARKQGEARTKARATCVTGESGSR